MPLRRAARRFNQLLTVGVVIWIAAHLFPQVLFREQLTADRVTIHSRELLPTQQPIAFAKQWRS
ncbi:MAG: hypothetical protein ABR526_04275 [Chthoniobacterales bacterium]